MKISRRDDFRRRAVELGEGPRTFTIAMLGDSVLYGEGSEYEVPALDHVVRRLAGQQYRVVINNYAVTGQTIAELTEKQLPQVGTADLVFIYIGANDYFRFTSAKSFADHVDQLLEQLSGKTIIWCTLADPRLLFPLPLWLRSVYYRYALAYSKYVQSAVRKHANEQWYTIDLLHEGRLRISLQRLRKRAILSDGFHLSDAGHELWCSIVADGYDVLKQGGAKLP